ncbi:hypothetical protein HY256_08735 [Candidatus Sumerlaeota bacterium]|nr:hypothetical protein [Candidatus Sumerlaeota bacterium]
MAAYRKQLVIENPDHLVLTGLSFRPGAHVEISIEEDNRPRSDAGRRWENVYNLGMAQRFRKCHHK